MGMTRALLLKVIPPFKKSDAMLSMAVVVLVATDWAMVWCILPAGLP